MVMTGPAVGGRGRAAAQWWAGGSTSATVTRFALVGGAANVVYGVLFLLGTQAGGGVQAANASAALVSSVLANELHRRFTFAGPVPVSWFRAQVAGTAAAVGGLVVTSAALLLLHVWLADPSRLLSMVVSMVSSALTGIVRFVVLRAAIVQPTR